MTEGAAVTTPPHSNPAGAPRKRSRRAGVVAWIAILPAAIGLLVAYAYPIFDGVSLSFTDWAGAGDPGFIGTDNYLQAFSDPAVAKSILLTLGFAVASSLGTVGLAAVLAAAVSARAPGSGIYRVVWFLPGVAPVTAVAVFWTTAFQPGPGFVNTILGAVGLGSDHAWLADPNTAIFPLIFVTIWSSAGFAFLLLLGAMEQIPVSIYEAAAVDGASRARQFFALTLPLIRPVLVIVLMLELIWAANGFSVVYAMTKGGPGDATLTLPILVYKEAFTLTHYGLASALAVVSGVILLIIGLISLRVSRSGQEASR